MHHGPDGSGVSKKSLKFRSHPTGYIGGLGRGEHHLRQLQVAPPLGDGGSWRAVGTGSSVCHIGDKLRKNRIARATGLEQFGQ